MKLYLLSTYGEYGAENVRATTDKEKVVSLFDEIGKEYNILETEKAKLLSILEDDDKYYPDGIDITDGWGGIQLHIVELE